MVPVGSSYRITPLVSAQGFPPPVALPMFPSILLFVAAAAPLPAAPIAPALCSGPLLLPKVRVLLGAWNLLVVGIWLDVLLEARVRPGA